MSSERKVPRQKGRPMQVNSISERVVMMRANGMSYRDIATALGTTESSCRTLFCKRRRYARQLLASDKNAEWIDGQIRSIDDVSA